MELLTAAGLSSAAGLNAYIPLLILGLLNRFTAWVALPEGWGWLSNGWALGILAVLLVIEVVADKIPVVDSFNDVLQTVVRPASGGLVFASGVGAQTIAVNNPDATFGTSQWVPLVIGAGIALIFHLLKSGARPLLNLGSAGVAAPVVSTAEDGASLGLSVLAIALPVVVIIVVVGLGVLLLFGVAKLRPRRMRKAI
ncbi:DUF4126 domain-containing protein [Paeniglutamicibacter sp. Y32M11]|jgi:hypothetical protein|uniref:DUF4126 domain-containing protein n=1 Tax=Paeniglutamicibacter sp. Y32M11 TaxID=2853258 RepID=UPI00104E575B|nr:DUF4126 domain-containing protein [Paeniglutamicibacter sp. Y32M11]QXQ10681.1 DUF4126 domain-containing protein [Paeniglutamicibacter sp. Y32M11]